ncbi:glycosyltransferase, partial [uncultured Helicobacter sp.]
MNTPIISLIIPVYNVRPYISRCLESCINQSLKEIE